MLLAMLGALSSTLGTTALATAAGSQPRPAAALVTAHSVAADSDSGAGLHRCAKRAIRNDGPDDDKFKTQQDRERAASRRVVDLQLDAAQPEGCSILPPGATFQNDPPSTEDRYEYRAYRTFDGRAPPRTRS
ncbi:hypothetical protein GCM10025762_33300 [Haloechinothrix salitolerans]